MMSTHPSPQDRRFTLVVNPHAGAGRARERGTALQTELASRGLDAELIATQSIEHAQLVAEQAAAAGRIAVGCGGDGLLRAVAAGVHAAARAGAPRPLMAIQPGGRGNDFARTLGLPSEPALVAAQLATAAATPIDLIEVGEAIALGNVYVGFDSRTNELANALRRDLGRFTYTYAGARVALTLPRLRIELEIDGTAYAFDGQGVTIASSAYYGGAMNIAPGADPRDGVLEVICFAQTARLARAAALVALLRGRHERRADVHRFTARDNVTITLAPPMLAFSDGDPIATTPLTARLLPGAIGLLGA